MSNDLTNTNLTEIKNLIYVIRGQKVMLDRDLAELYGVPVKVLNQAVKRNIERFPDDFMFRLSNDEWQNLRSQFVTFKKDIRKYMPYAFTEYGVSMLANILNSNKAVRISVEIIRAFIQLRQYAISQTNKNQEIEELRKMLMLHIENTDNRFNQDEKTIQQIISVLNNLIEKPREPKPVGFKTK